MNTTESSSQIVSEEQQTEERTRRKRTRHALVFEDVETESPASVSDEDILITRGRGRGSIRGRCRGRRQRGGRLFRGRQFEEGEEEKLVRLHEERRQKADDMIDRLTDTEKTSMLKEVAVRQPAIILDVATILSTRDEEPHEPGPSVPVPSWCVCQKSPPMERDADKLCCGMAPHYCNSRRPVAPAANVPDDVFARQAESLEDTNKAFRHAAYRQYILWVFGRLQRDDRRTVPACRVQVIRDKFPSPGGDYTGFIPSTHGIGW